MAADPTAEFPARSDEPKMDIYELLFLFVNRLVEMEATINQFYYISSTVREIPRYSC